MKGNKEKKNILKGKRNKEADDAARREVRVQVGQIFKYLKSVTIRQDD